MPELSDLLGKTVKYRCPRQGFIRYGELIEVGGRVRDKKGRVTSTGRRVKNPTVGAVQVKMPNGVIQRVPVQDVLAWVHYGVERPLEWRPN